MQTDPFTQQRIMRAQPGTVVEVPPPMMVMTKRTFRRTFGFWFIFATINGFWGGFGVCELLHLAGWIK